MKSRYIYLIVILNETLHFIDNFDLFYWLDIDTKYYKHIFVLQSNRYKWMASKKLKYKEELLIFMSKIPNLISIFLKLFKCFFYLFTVD